MKTYPITKLIVDFDQTITVKDTIANIVYAAADNRDDREGFIDAWNRVVEWFSREYTQVIEKLFSQPAPAQNTCDVLLKSAECKNQRSVFLQRKFEIFEEIEMASIERVVSGKFLANTKREQLQTVGRGIEKQPCVETTLTNMTKSGIQIDVLSANWSKDMIIGAMAGLYDNLVSNDLKFDANGISTGELSLQVVSASDKLQHYHRLKSKTGNNLYIGDSLYDLLPMLEAEIGVLFGRSRSVMRAISHFNLPFKELTNADKFSPQSHSKGVILTVDSWELLDNFLACTA